MASNALTRRIGSLNDERVPFVQATVVRAQCPTSARPGDGAVILGDGSIEGFVGGQCAETSVRLAALEVLASRQSLLLRILPEDSVEFPQSPGARTVINPCLSGGALEIFLEPRLPAHGLLVIGETPIANALVRFGRDLGFDVNHSAAGAGDPRSASAVIIASHGRAEPESARRALDLGVGYIGIVASERRSAQIRTELELNPEENQVVHSPVGLRIGAKTAEEIALSILADVVRAIRVDGLEAPKQIRVNRPQTALDPVCGMKVEVGEATPYLRVNEADYWFCNVGCRTRFKASVS